MSIYVSHGRAMMAKSFYDYAKGSGTSPLWFGFCRGLDDTYQQSNYSWDTLQETNGGAPWTIDEPPDPIIYPGPKSKTLTNTSATAALPVKYYSVNAYTPDLYKRVTGVQFIYPDPAGSIIYLENTYSAYEGSTGEQEAMAADCNLVRISCYVSYQDLVNASINPADFTTRQIGLYNQIDSAVTVPPSHPNMLTPTDLAGFAVGEDSFGLCLVDNTLPYHRVEYQRDEFSFVLQF